MDETPQSPKVWLYQDEFLAEASRLVERVFSRLGVSPAPALGLVAFPSYKEGAYEPIIARTSAMRWDPCPKDWNEKVVEAQRNLDDAGHLLAYFRRSSNHALALHRVVETHLGEHDRTGTTRSFLSQGASTWNYDLVVVLEFERAVFDSYPRTTAPIKLFEGSKEAEVGLLDATVTAVLDRLFHELCKGDAGLHKRIDRRDVDDVLRDAGQVLMRAVRLSVSKNLFGNLFEWINSVSALRYENAEASGGIVFGSGESSDPFDLKLTRNVLLSESVSARKTLQMTSERLLGYSDGTHLVGLARRGSDGNEFIVRFKGQSRWELSRGITKLVDVHLGVPSFPDPPLRREVFVAAFCRVFPGLETSIDDVWPVVEAALGQRHGTMVVITQEAENEVTRLWSQAMSIEPTVLDHEVLLRATAIDGAVLLDPKGRCHAVGVILDGYATAKGEPGRGARFNSGVRYVNDGDGRLVVVVSEDGRVDLLPRLRPSIRRAEFDEMLARLRPYANAQEVPEEFQAICLRLTRHYWDYVGQAGLQDVVWRGALESMGFDLGEGPKGLIGTYEGHSSDLLE